MEKENMTSTELRKIIHLEIMAAYSMIIDELYFGSEDLLEQAIITLKLLQKNNKI